MSFVISIPYIASRGQLYVFSNYSFLFTGLTPFNFDTSKVLHTCQILLWKKKKIVEFIHLDVLK